MNGMDPGMMAGGLAMLQTERNKGYSAEWDAKIAARQQSDAHNKYVFAAKSHVHGLRAQVHAHKQTEDELIAALKAENANHPFASREAVDAAVEDKRVRALVDPEVIKRTYPDGKLPDGTVIPPGGVWTIA